MADDLPRNVTELIDLIERQRRQLIDYVEAVPQSALVHRRDAAGWSAKDHLAHLAMWERSIDYLLQKRPRHEGLGVSEEVYLEHDPDKTNGEIFRQHRDKDLETVRREFDEIHAGLLATLRGLTWQDLHRSYSYYDPDEPGEDSGDPIIYWVAGNTFGHYGEHLGWLRDLLEPVTELRDPTT